MKKITTTQLADITGVPIKNIYTYSKRGKIRLIKSGDNNVVDIDDPVNLKFAIEQSNKHGLKLDLDNIKAIRKQPPRKGKVASKKKPDHKPTTNRKATSKKPGSKKGQQIIPPITELELHKTEKMKQDALIAKLNFEKRAGRMMPVEVTQHLFNIHFSNVTRTYHNAADNYTIVMNEKLGGTKKDLAYFRSKLMETLDEAIETAVQLTEKDIQKAAADFALTD